MKILKILLIAVGGIIAIVIGGQYASCDSFVCDWLGNISGWFKNLLGQAQDVGSSEPSAMDMAVTLIAGFEGFRSHAYNDQAGILTIGYGHQIVPGDGFDASSTISESQARDLLAQDAATAQTCVRSTCSSVALSPKQEAALISLCYNIGCNAFNNSSLSKAINLGDYAQATAEFSRWVYAKGVQLPALVSRRDSEAQLFQEGSAYNG